VLVTFAVDAEFAPWRKLRKFEESILNPNHYSGGVRVQKAQIGECEVFVFLTGMAIKFFDFEASSCIKDAGIDLAISSGLAGALKDEVPALAIVCPSRTGNLRDAVGTALSKVLLDLAGQKGAILIDGLLTADHIVDSHEEKSRLAVFGDAVDMESFHVVTTFAQDNIPVVVIRGISDGNDEDLPVNFEKCLTPAGSVKIVPLLKDVLVQPSKVPALIRFGRQSRAAAEKLARFLDDYIQALTPEILSQKNVEAII